MHTLSYEHCELCTVQVASLSILTSGTCTEAEFRAMTSNY